MEQPAIFPPGTFILTLELLERRLGMLPQPGRRTSPRGSQERPRGDHDLNPDFFDPDREVAKAAVLVPLVARETPTVLLTRRSEDLAHHAGQIAFPGGMVEDCDSTPEACALREAEEEIGLAAEKVRIVGRLDTYVTRTGFEVTPVVGLLTPPFELAPDPLEVAAVFEVPLDFLLRPESCQRHTRTFQGKERHFYAFPYEAHFIWGATAGMLVNLVEILGNELPG